MGMSGTDAALGRAVPRAPARDFEVIVYDHRGVGASSRLDGPITIAAAGRATRPGCSRALELDSAHVLGISMGGMVAQELVLAEPELRAHADARLHLLRRARAARSARPRCAAAGRGDDAPATASAPLRAGVRGQRLAGGRRRRRAVGALPASRRARGRRGAGDHGPGGRLRRARHPRAPARIDTPDARDPRHRRRAAPGRERPPDRRR